jgi:hypothetical protein
MEVAARGVALAVELTARPTDVTTATVAEGLALLV